MALAYWNPNSMDETNEGNFTPTTFYYETDRSMVMNQDGADSVGLLNFKFRKKPVTVFAAKDEHGNILPLLALPCPPWYPDDVREAIPGNILSEEEPDEDTKMDIKV